MSPRSIWVATCIVLLGASACAGPWSGLPSGPAASGAAVARGDISHNKVIAVAGTYDGSLTEVEGSHERSGHLTIVIKQNGKKITGTFTPQFSSGSQDLAIDGSIKSDKAKKAKIAFTIEDPKGRNASGSATVTAKKLNGRATVPSSSGKGGVTITFKTRRKKNDR
ncbi:MAG TPA: hypothetical protein VFE16_13085 [Candidatus Cybelea sp.]|nr:hypothetical protein [Candidatus Cybelea sp.]